MIWRVNIRRDYGMDTVVETDSRFTTDAYRSIQRTMHEVCRNPGDYCRVSINARNDEGLTLISEGMGWSQDGLRRFEDALFEATEKSIREGIL